MRPVARMTRSTRVSNSVMPKGVEHFNPSTADAELNDVSNSVMPKGVEHKWYGYKSGDFPVVSNSVMPKGVEHIPLRKLIPPMFMCRIQ